MTTNHYRSGFNSQPQHPSNGNIGRHLIILIHDGASDENLNDYDYARDHHFIWNHFVLFRLIRFQSGPYSCLVFNHLLHWLFLNFILYR